MIFLSIDGHPIGQLVSIENVIPHSAPAALSRSGSPTKRAVIGESVMLFGTSGSAEIFRWIQDTASRKWNRRNMTIGVVDQARMTISETEMYNCLVTQATLPALDKSSSANAVIRLRVKPEFVRAAGPHSIKTLPFLPPLKPWTASNFEFSIDGLDDTRYAQKISSLVLNQAYKTIARQSGDSTIEPTKTEDSNVVITLPVARADGILKWFESGLIRNNRASQRTGSILYLRSDKKRIAMANLYELTPIKAVTISGHSMQAEMAVGRVDFDFAVMG